MSQYYEAIIQIRPGKKEILDFIKKQLETRKDIFVSRKVDLKTGSDIYISNQRFAKALGMQLKKRFKGELKITRSLYGKKDGRRIYRVTVLFRLN
ncbi:MAG: NMD3-related protein [Nanoarchaeota archaeon]